MKPKPMKRRKKNKESQKKLMKFRKIFSFKKLKVPAWKNLEEFTSSTKATPDISTIILKNWGNWGKKWMKKIYLQNSLKNWKNKMIENSDKKSLTNLMITATWRQMVSKFHCFYNKKRIGILMKNTFLWVMNLNKLPHFSNNLKTRHFSFWGNRRIRNLFMNLHKVSILL